MRIIFEWIFRIAGIISFGISVVLTFHWVFKFWNIALIFLDFKTAITEMIKPLIFMAIACILCHISENKLSGK